MTRRFSFDLYRLNIEDAEDLFTQSQLKRLRRDEDIAAVLEKATESEQDQIQKTRTAVFEWGVREFRNLAPGGHPKCSTYGHPNCSTRRGVA